LLDGDLEGAGGQIEDVVGLEDRIGGFAAKYLIYVKRDDGTVIADGADEMQVAEFTGKVDASGERGGLGEGERRVRCERNAADGVKVSEQIDDADARDDDGVAGEKWDVGEIGARRIAAEIDSYRLSDASAMDGDDVAGGSRKAAGGGEYIEQTSRT